MSSNKKYLDGITIALETRVETYLELAKRVRTDHSPSIIHDFRVASRRLLVIERLLRSCSKTAYWRNRSRDWLKTLNRLRDLHVLSERFRDMEKLGKRLAGEIGQEQARWKRASRKVARKPFRKKLGKSLSKYHSRVERKPGTIGEVIPGLWLECYQGMQKCMDSADREDPTSLHKLRVQYKSLRYFVELAQDADLLDGIKKSELKYWQDLLGEIHDLDVAEHWLKQTDNNTGLLQALQQEAARLREKFWTEKDGFQRFVSGIDTRIRERLSV